MAGRDRRFNRCQASFPRKPGYNKDCGDTNCTTSFRRAFSRLQSRRLRLDGGMRKQTVAVPLCQTGHSRAASLRRFPYFFGITHLFQAKTCLALVIFSKGGIEGTPVMSTPNCSHVSDSITKRCSKFLHDP